MARHYVGVVLSLLARFVLILHLKGFLWFMDKVRIVN